MKTSKPRVALIAGPTASGKSALALRVAAAANGVVVNADASQVYRDLHVLSARPSAADEAGVPHRLFGYVDGAEICTAARWAADARETIGAVLADGRLPVLVGGTGLYIRTLLDGIAAVPPIDPAIRSEVRAMPVAQAHAALATADPAAGARLAPADTTRVARALEVIRSTGKPLSEWQREKTGGIATAIDLRGLVLLPPREPLFARIDQRTAAMLASGAIDEVAALARRSLPADVPVRRAIGVSEIEALLRGDATLSEVRSAIALATRRYAKRQVTWFRNQMAPGWDKQESFGEQAVIDILLYEH